jgi:hypothetical protein
MMNSKIDNQPVQRVLRFAAIALAFLTAAAGPIPASADTTADELYLAVLELQLSLGDGPQGDAVRDRYLIRELETESARGFSGNPAVFHAAMNAFAGTAPMSPEFERVRAALAAHVAMLDQAAIVDVRSFVSGLTHDLEPVTRADLSAQRDLVLASLAELTAFHESTLSIYGRHYINRYLGVQALERRLQDFDFGIDIGPIPGEAAPEDQEFNRELNTLRGELGDARQRFAFKSANYPNRHLARAENAIATLERQVFAFLLGRTTRALETFEEDFDRRRVVFSNTGAVADEGGRLFQAELGRLMGLLDDRQKGTDLRASARRQFSLPNLKVTINESLVNRLAARPVSEVAHVDEVIVGSRAQGWSWTQGLVTLDFIDHPFSAHVRLAFNGTVESNAYTSAAAGRVRVYTSSHGMLAADRDLAVNVGNLSIFPINAWADMHSRLHGTNSGALVSRIASRQFYDRQSVAEAHASARARDRVYESFAEGSDEALMNGLQQLGNMRARRSDFLRELNEFRKEFSQILSQNEEGVVEGPVDMVDPFVMPRMYVKTGDQHLEIGGVLEGDNRLAAPTSPPPFVVPADFRAQLHESLVSNLIAPLVQDRLVQNWQFTRLAESYTSDPSGIPQADDERRWAILFDDGRPVQVAFEDNEVRVTLFGKEFRDERRRYTDPLFIEVRFRVVNHEGHLKLVRNGNARVDFTYPPAPGKTLEPEAIAFRQFLQDNLDDALSDDPEANAIDLPAHLLPLEMIDDQQLRTRLADARLVECVADDGWLSLGWNYVGAQGPAFWYATHTPSIWLNSPPLPAIDADPATEQ